MEKAVQELSRKERVKNPSWGSITEVARRDEVDPSNLRRKFLNRKKGHGGQKLSKDEEEQLVAVTVAWIRLHNNIVLRSVGPAAEAAFPDKGPFGSLRDLVRGFTKRWRHVLTIRKPQALTETRASPDGLDKMME